MQEKYNINQKESQVAALLRKTYIKKAQNVGVVEWLKSVGEHKRAYAVEHCAEYVGVTEINGLAKFVKADFCRERLCNVCAWRRQSKFVAQMIPVIEGLKSKYRFVFATVSVRNVSLENLKRSIDGMLEAYDRLLKRTKIKRAWVGKVRALELTYNEDKRTFHPHIHILIAVKDNYFKSEDYICTEELAQLWAESLGVNYIPVCDIRAVSEESRGVVETLKYSLKPSADTEALEGFFFALRGRRLVSFSGVFAEMRKLLKQSDFERILTDDISLPARTVLSYKLYKFDVTGGVYTFYKEMELKT